VSHLDNLLKQMTGTSGLPKSKEWNTPEHFARTAIRLGLRDYGFPIEVEASAFTDGFGDLGLDGVALALGDIPLLSAEDVPDAVAAGGGWNPLRIFMLQSKRKEIINESDAVLFGAAAQKFLTLKGRKDIERLKPSPSALAQWDIYDALRHANQAVAEAAHVTMIFAYRGDWRDYATVNTARQQAETNIRNAYPNMRIEFVVWGDVALVAAGERVGPAFRKTLKEVALLKLPEGPARGYIGYVSGAALVDLVAHKVGGKLEAEDHMFFENVRAFMGTRDERSNPGAVGLQKSLQGNGQPRVLLCHNGVVVVASQGELLDGAGKPLPDGQAPGGNLAIRLTAPQIVNGCQTCNVLVANVAHVANCFVPIKIILTEDEDLKDSIILASNTQAAVDDYDMLARNEGLRALQHTFERGEAQLRERVWLQRRREEPIDWPSHWKNPDWSRVVRPRHLLDAYASTILGIPHTAHETPGKIIDLGREGDVFGQEPTLYRALAWLVVTGRRWARRHNKNWQDRYAHSGAGAYPARHQYVYALWRLVDDSPDDTSKEKIGKSGSADQRFQGVINRLIDHNDAYGDAAGRVVEETARTKGEKVDRALAQRKYFTEAVRKTADASKKSLPR
jgi:AIPR protein